MSFPDEPRVQRYTPDSHLPRQFPLVATPGAMDCRLLPPCGRDGNRVLHFHS